MCPEEGHKEDQRADLYKNRLRQLWLFRLEKENLRGNITGAFQYLKWAYRKRGRVSFYIDRQ